MVLGREVVAVLPAAGRSRRLAPISCSKELLPIGLGTLPGIEGTRVKVVSSYLLEHLREAGVRKCYVVIREGKWDIPAYWNDGKRLGMDFAYLVIENSTGPPDTIDRAYAFVKDKIVAFGFPDILLRPTAGVFNKLLDRLDSHRADVVLGLFPAHDPKTMDMVDVDAHHRVNAIHLKPRRTRLKYGWLCAVWTPAFTMFLHQFMQSPRLKAGLIGNRKIDPQGDIPVGAVLRAGLRAKLKIEGELFRRGRYIDIGTPQALFKIQRIIS
jgi:glucose-1-phosphate thymidylyltransferase